MPSRKAMAAVAAAPRASAVTRAARPPARYGGDFTGVLFRYPGSGGWTFVRVPDRLAPPVTHAWGRTPVEATVDGQSWRTSVWRGKDGRTLLAIPKGIRGAKGDGDKVKVRISFDAL